jgi:thiosulfate dehydrogenase
MDFLKSYPLFIVFLLLDIVVITSVLIGGIFPNSRFKSADSKGQERIALWQAPDTSDVSFRAEGDLIPYGRELIANTSYYLGPNGKVAAITNGMNCQNCHLDAGTRPWGNNYGGVYPIYPRFRERSGTIENIHKRVNDCLQRSLNGKILDTNSKEMRAMSTYINWLGKNTDKGKKPAGSGITDIPFMTRAADTIKGRLTYMEKCRRCHGNHGEGLMNMDKTGYTYPPLWGDNSYGTAAGLFRISRFAGLVRDNMPYGVMHDAPQLSNEEAWDVAAFVNSQPRPLQIFKEDWPDITKKPIDHPFGPFADGFSEQQHKYGPFGPIVEARMRMKKEKETLANNNSNQQLNK